ncbi:MAG: hypothetical protein PF444_09795 [Bacteroidales bacterium]|jgi:hypothetical protein|nr:hypothetical protein [Bacteroidales bacterium]
MRTNDQVEVIPGKRISFSRIQTIKGTNVEVLFHFYPLKKSLFAIANGSIKCALRGTKAVENFNKLYHERTNKTITKKIAIAS